MSNAVMGAAMYQDITKTESKPKTVKKGQLKIQLRESRQLGTLNDAQLMGHIVWRHRMFLIAFTMGAILSNAAWIVLSNR